MTDKKCPCGSGQYRRELKDSAGIFCTYTCDECEGRKRESFNMSIFEPGTAYAVTGNEEDIGREEDY